LRHQVTEREEGVAAVRAARAMAAIGVACLALLLASLPFVAVLGLLPVGEDAAGRLAVTVAAVVGGGKLVALALGLASSQAAPELAASAPPID
jgi:hypothetical protein